MYWARTAAVARSTLARERPWLSLREAGQGRLPWPVNASGSGKAAGETFRIRRASDAPEQGVRRG